MTEIFEDIGEDVKNTAEIIWNLTMTKINNPLAAAEFLNNTVEHYKAIYSEEEIQFLQFYFQMRMEMMKK